MERIFAVVTGIVEKQAVVVCFHSRPLYEQFKSAPRLGISHGRITQQEAVKLLVEANGVGIGCYVSSGEADADALRATRARKNKVEFAKKANIPVFLHVERLEPNTKEREVLKLRNNSCSASA